MTVICKEGTKNVMFSSDKNNVTPSEDVRSHPWHRNTGKLLKAIEEHNFEAVQVLVSSGVPVNACGGAFNESPLHKAAQQGWIDGVELLLDSGADVFSKNYYDQTPLHYACASKSFKCVRLMLDAESQVAIHQQDKRGHTPLHDASAKGCVKCVSLLLKAGAIVDVRDVNDETPLHKAAKASSIPSMLVLLNKGADLGIKDKSTESALTYLLRLAPGGIETLFDHCLNMNNSKTTYKKLEINFNFLPLSGHSEQNQVRILRSVVDLGHSKVLQHPLCESYLLLKWTNVRRYYFFEVLFYFTYAILASLLILDKFVFDYYDYIKYSHFNISDQAFRGILVIVLTQAGLILLKEVLMMVQDIRTWIYSVWHVSNCGVSIFAFMVLIGERQKWQHHFATIMVLWLWVQCMLHISRFPSCGIYVAMFTKVARVFVRIFAIFFCLLLAFSMSFYVSKFGDGYPHTSKNCTNATSMDDLSKCVNNTDATTEKYVFKDPITAFLKTLTMMVGELDFDGNFVFEMEILMGTSHLIFLGFVILVSVILSNLLVALAVNDVQGLRNSANLERLIKQMELVFQMEKTFTTLDYAALLFRLCNFAERRKAIMHDLLKARITLEPHHPSKGNRILISNKGNLKEVNVKKTLVVELLRCLSTREEITTAGVRRLSVKRLTTVRGSSSQAEDLQEMLKVVEAFSTEVSQRMENIMSMCISIDSRLKSVEDSIHGKPTATDVRPYSPIIGPHPLPERNPLVVSPEESEIIQQTSDGDVNITV